MTSILALVLFIIFLILSLIHFNWAIGGALGFDNALPTNEKGERVLNPKKIDSAVVGLGLLLMGVFYLSKSDVLTLDLPSWAANSAGWVISTIFLLRAIGDFKYVGFTKRVKNTNFGKNDSKYYAPLCLIISVIGLYLELA